MMGKRNGKTVMVRRARTVNVESVGIVGVVFKNESLPSAAIIDLSETKRKHILHQIMKCENHTSRVISDGCLD